MEINDLSEDKIKKLLQPLKWFKENTEFIETCAIINSQEGLIIASTCNSEIEEQNIAAITTTVYGNADRMASQLNKGYLKKFFLETENGYIVICIITDATLLTILAGNKSNLGLIFLNLKKILKQIKEII